MFKTLFNERREAPLIGKTNLVVALGKGAWSGSFRDFEGTVGPSGDPR